MQVTTLYFDGCPHQQIAEERLREALDRVGCSNVAVAGQQVTSVQRAGASSFRASPTILVDGRDSFADPQARVGLSCRVYATDADLSRAATVEQLVEVLDG